MSSGSQVPSDLPVHEYTPADTAWADKQAEISKRLLTAARYVSGAADEMRKAQALDDGLDADMAPLLEHMSKSIDGLGKVNDILVRRFRLRDEERGV